MEWREQGGVRWLEAELPGATAVFTTRTGGVSEAPYDGLNLGVLTDDDPEAVAENRRRLATALGISPERIAFGRQVHGADLEIHTDSSLDRSFAASGGSGGGGVTRPEVDGHVVRRPGTAVLVFVADCVPVALAGPGGVAMLHCGWRGLASSGPNFRDGAAEGAAPGLIERGVAAVAATAAAIGPSIGPCCYEVGGEVLDEFDWLAGEAGARRMLDLPEVARRILLAAGVKRIESSGLCTSCDSELFFSHRRDHGRTGRQAGVAWVDREGG